MGLVYNNKNKLDIEILSEEKLEKNEGKLCDFVIIPESHDESTDNSDKEKKRITPPYFSKSLPLGGFFCAATYTQLRAWGIGIKKIDCLPTTNLN